MFIDKGNVDKVVYNILSNAFKYTPSKGKIEFVVNVDEAAGKLKMRVSDTGSAFLKKNGENCSSGSCKVISLVTV